MFDPEPRNYIDIIDVDLYIHEAFTRDSRCYQRWKHDQPSIQTAITANTQT